MLKETFSDVGSDGEFDQNFKLSVLTTVVNHKLYNDFVLSLPHAIQKEIGKLKINSFKNKTLLYICFFIFHFFNFNLIFFKYSCYFYTSCMINKEKTL